MVIVVKKTTASCAAMMQQMRSQAIISVMGLLLDTGSSHRTRGPGQESEVELGGDFNSGAHAQVLSKSEVEWVNNYHKEVWEKASPRMSGDALEWLRENTAPLDVPIPQVAAMA